jgi:hypothetical protein
VEQRKKDFSIALALTILDFVVSWQDGPIVWQAWGGVPWIRIGLLLLAGAGSFTLVDVWARALDATATGFVQPQIEGNEALANEALEGADV